MRARVTVTGTRREDDAEKWVAIRDTNNGSLPPPARAWNRVAVPSNRVDKLSHFSDDSASPHD